MESPGTRVLGWAIGTSLLVASLLAPAVPAATLVEDDAVPTGASLEDTELIEFTLAELLPDSQIYHPDVLSQVMPESARIDTLRSDLSVAMRDQIDADARRLDALARRGDAERERWSQRVVVDDRLAAEAAAQAAADEAFDQLGAFAVDSFLGSEAVDLARISMDGAMSPLPGLTDGASEVIEERHESAKAALAHARQGRIEAENLAADIAEREAVAQSDLALAEADLADAESRIDDLRPQLEQALVGQMVPGTDMSMVVIDAYFRAAIQMADRRPNCGISWDQLAGVGLIESRHGSFGGSSVGPDGRTSKEILGPVLNGEEFAAIADTDGGALDGNLEWDRAVGPMQFIPSSWQIYGLDGNGDGVLDPHNLYDAAYAAAEHLCRGYSGLQNQSTYRSALLGYNRSAVYGSDVIAAQQRYRSAVDLEPTPEGIAEDLERRGIEASLTGS